MGVVITIRNGKAFLVDHCQSMVVVHYLLHPILHPPIHPLHPILHPLHFEFALHDYQIVKSHLQLQMMYKLLQYHLLFHLLVFYTRYLMNRFVVLHSIHHYIYNVVEKMNAVDHLPE